MRPDKPPRADRPKPEDPEPVEPELDEPPLEEEPELEEPPPEDAAADEPAPQEPAPEEPKKGIDPKVYREEMFKIVCGSFVDIYKSFHNLMRDLVVFSLLVMGWLVTSRFSQGYIRTHLVILYTSLVMIGLIFAMYSIEALRIVRISRRKLAQLDEIGYADRAFYRNYRVTPTMAFFGIVLVCAVFTLLCSTLLTV